MGIYSKLIISIFTGLILDLSSGQPDISWKEHMVAASVVVPTLLGAFGIIRIMTNLKFIVDEMDDKMAKTAYGQEIKSVPISALKLIFAGMFIIVGIFQLTVIY